MKKSNVFVVTGRLLVDGVPRGAIQTMVVCAPDEKGVRKLVGQKRPMFGITTVTGLVPLEARAKKVLNVLAHADTEWEVLVDPALAG